MTATRSPADRLRVLRIVTRLNIGGPAHEIAPLCRLGSEHGVDTLLVAGSPAPSEGELFDAIDIGSARRARVEALGRAVRPLRDRRALRALRAIADEFAPDVIHTHTSKAGLLGRRIGGPQTVRCHTFHGTVFAGHFGPLRSAAIARLERVLARRTDAVIALGPRLGDDLRARGVDHVHVVEPGFDPERLARFRTVDRRAARTALGIDADRIVVAIVGRLAPVKGVDRLIESLARVRPPVLVVIAGDGPERAALERSAARDVPARHDVRFLGWRDDPERVVGAADVVALPSRSEGVPHGVVEALVAGRAIVACAVGEVPALLGDGRGCAVADDTGAFGRALDAVVGDAAVRARLEAGARAFVPRTSAAMVAETCDLYRRLAGARG